MEEITVLHEVKTMPLVNIEYHVFVGNNLLEIATHTAKTFAGITLKLAPDDLGYVGVVEHPNKGGAHVILIADDGESNPLLTVVNYATSLVWNICEHAEINLGINSHKIQSYMMEEIVDQVMNVLNDFHENNIDDNFGEL